MNLFRKKITLPEGPARMSVSPSASKKEIGNPAASIGLVIPEAPNYDEERGRQLARSDSYATFFKTGVGLFYHESLHGRKAPRGNRGGAHPLHRNDGIHLSRSRSQPDHPGRTAPGAHRPETRSPSSPLSSPNQSNQSDTHAPRNPRDEGVGHEQSHEHRTAWYVGAGQRRPRLFSRVRLPRR